VYGVVGQCIMNRRWMRGGWGGGGGGGGGGGREGGGGGVANLKTIGDKSFLAINSNILQKVPSHRTREEFAIASIESGANLKFLSIGLIFSG